MFVSAQCLRNFQTFFSSIKNIFSFSPSLSFSFYLNLCCQFQPVVIMIFFFFDSIFSLPNIWFALFLFGIVFGSLRWILCTFTSIESIMCGWMLFHCWQWDPPNGCHPLDDLICYKTDAMTLLYKSSLLFYRDRCFVQMIMICNLWVVSSHRAD